MEIVPLGPGFAAELRGMTLSEIAADDAAYTAARAAFEEHSVLVFRGQQVTDEVQLAFSRRFGPPEVTKIGSLGTGTHFVTISTIGDDGKVVPPDHRLALRNKANQLWHTDSSFKSMAAGSRTALPGTTMRIRVARSRPASRPRRSVRRCRRNAGVWPGRIRKMAATRSISPRTPTPSKACNRRPEKS